MSMLRPVCHGMNCVNFLYSNPDAYPEELQDSENSSNYSARRLYRKLRLSLKTSDSKAFVEVLDEIVSKNLDHLVFGTLSEQLDEYGLVVEGSDWGKSPNFAEVVSITLREYADRNPLWGFLSEAIAKEISYINEALTDCKEEFTLCGDCYIVIGSCLLNDKENLLTYLSKRKFTDELHPSFSLDIAYYVQNYCADPLCIGNVTYIRHLVKILLSKGVLSYSDLSLIKP